MNSYEIKQLAPKFEPMIGAKTWKKYLMHYSMYASWFLVIIVSLTVSRLSAASGNSIAILIDEDAVWMEKHAATELQKYIRMTTGEETDIIASEKLIPSKVVFLVAIRESNSLVENLLMSNLHARSG